MFIRSMTLCLLSLFATASAHAYLELVEDAIEASTKDISLPEDGSSRTIVVRRCVGCTPMLLRLTDGTRSFIDRREVTYRELRELARQTTAGLYVYYSPDNLEITRIVLRP